MNISTDIEAIQIDIERYIQKNYHRSIDAMKWESLGDGTLRLVLYRGGEQSVLVITKKELQSYILKGWEQSFQEKLRSVVQDDQQKKPTIIHIIRNVPPDALNWCISKDSFFTTADNK